MTYTISRNAVFMLGGGTVQLISSGYSFDQSADTPDATTFGQVGRRHIVGLKGGTFSIDGYVQNADLANHYNWVTHRTSVPASDITWGRAGEKWAVLLPDGILSGAGKMIAFKFFNSGVNIGGAIGDVAPFAFTAQIDGDVYSGHQLLDFRRTSTGASSQAALTEIPAALQGAPGSDATRKDHLLIVAFRDVDSDVHNDGVKMSMVDEFGSGPTRELETATILAAQNRLTVLKFPFDVDNAKPRLRLDTVATYRIGFLASDDALAKNKIGASGTDAVSAVRVGVLAPDYTIAQAY